MAEDNVEEAAWWLTRWISGSMDDPDWDDSWTTIGVEQAFAILHKVAGNRRSVGKPLWRFLYLPQTVAQQIIKARVLPPYDKSPFQSFSLSRKVAEEDGPSLIGVVPKKSVQVLISAEPAPDTVLFGMPDLKTSRNPSIRDDLRRVADWHHQQEVIVRVQGPLPLLSAEILPS